MKKMKTALGCLLFIVLFSSGFSQEGEWIEVRDFETWTSAGVQMKLNKKWEFGLSEQIRLKEDSKKVDEYFSEFEFGYIGFEHFELGGGLRYIKENDDQGKIQGWENHFRFNLDLSYKHDIDRLELKYRLRFQNKNELGVNEEQGDSTNNTLRFKVGADYNIKNWKLDPKFSVEIFNRLGNGSKSGLSKFRVTLGTSYNLKKWGSIQAFYRMERELNPTFVDYPKTTHIAGLSYVYTFKINTK